MEYGSKPGMASLSPSAAGYAGIANEVARQPFISSACGSLEAATSDITELINELEKRLIPIMRASVPTPACDTSKSIATTPLAETLTNLSECLSHSGARLRDVLNRIEL